MGQAQSQNVMTMEEFKDKLFGAAVMTVYPRMENANVFKDADKITEEEAGDYLPKKKTGSDFYKYALEYYNHSESAENHDDLVNQFVEKNILSSKEKFQNFMEAYLDTLANGHPKRNASKARSRARETKRSVQPRPVEESRQSNNPLTHRLRQVDEELANLGEIVPTTARKSPATNTKRSPRRRMKPQEEDDERSRQNEDERSQRTVEGDFEQETYAE